MNAADVFASARHAAAALRPVTAVPVGTVMPGLEDRHGDFIVETCAGSVCRVAPADGSASIINAAALQDVFVDLLKAADFVRLMAATRGPEVLERQIDLRSPGPMMPPDPFDFDPGVAPAVTVAEMLTEDGRYLARIEHGRVIQAVDAELLGTAFTEHAETVREGLRRLGVKLIAAGAVGGSY